MVHSKTFVYGGNSQRIELFARCVTRNTSGLIIKAKEDERPKEPTRACILNLRLLRCVKLHFDI